ncbi:MAG: CHAT domain-containing protein, partial [Anaerolineales bacterium]|nr:CHAT domain-containing protein [Anaerolineales bacterium]
ELLAARASQNQGVCYRLMGRYKEALQAYEKAEQHYKRADVFDHMGDIHNNRGLILLHLGRVSDALEAFQTAEAITAASGRTLIQAQSLFNIGDAQLMLGHYRESLAALDEAHHLLDAMGKLAQSYNLLLQRGHVYLALNLHPEALAAYSEAEEACRASGMKYYLGRALWGKGMVLTAERHLTEASTVFAEAANLFMAAENAPMFCTVQLEQANILALQGDETTAIDLAEDVLQLIQKNEWPVQQLYTHLRLADLHMEPKAIQHHLKAAQTLLEMLALPHLRYRLQQRWGAFYWSQNQPEQARPWLEAAVAEIEQLRGTVAQEVMRTSFLRDKTIAYEQLLQLHLAECEQNPTAIPNAFLTAERAKSRTLLDLINGVITIRDFVPADEAIAQKQQQLEADLNAVYNAFLDDTLTTAEAKELETKARQLEQSLRQLRIHAGDNISLNPFTQAFSPESLLKQHSRPHTLLAYHILQDEIVAFISVKDEMRVVRHLASAAAIQTQLQQLNLQWQRFRTNPQFIQRHMSRLLQSTNRILHTLYQQLIQPLRHQLPAASINNPHPLVIIPHGLLHQLPFHALFDGQQYLIEQYELSYAPSATVYQACWERPLRPLEKAVVIAVEDPLIPAATQEAHQIAEHLSQATLLTNEQATIPNLRQIVTKADVLHLATHGLFRADNPIFSALKLHDGWLQAADVLSLSLAGALVTLSACESGRSQIDAGDEVLGLARAFMGAGAATLVVSLWLVQDETTAVLMADWYSRLKQNPQQRAATLRHAQLALKEAYPHPYYWA